MDPWRLFQKTQVFFIAPQDETFEKALNNIEEVKSRGGKITVITDQVYQVKKIIENIISIPSSGILSPIFSIVPFQILSYFLAIKKNIPVDRPRNLAKTVTVE